MAFHRGHEEKSPKQQRGGLPGLERLPAEFGAGARFATDNGFAPSAEQAARSAGIRARGMTGSYYTGEGRPWQPAKPDPLSPMDAPAFQFPAHTMQAGWPSRVDSVVEEERRFQFPMPLFPGFTVPVPRMDIHRMESPIQEKDVKDPTYFTADNWREIWKLSQKGLRGLGTIQSTIYDPTILPVLFGLVPDKPPASDSEAVSSWNYQALGFYNFMEEKERAAEQEISNVDARVLSLLPAFQRKWMTLKLAGEYYGQQAKESLNLFEATGRASAPLIGYLLCQPGWQEPGVCDRYDILQNKGGGRGGWLGQWENYAAAAEQSRAAGEIQGWKWLLAEAIADITNFIPIGKGVAVVRGGKSVLVNPVKPSKEFIKEGLTAIDVEKTKELWQAAIEAPNTGIVHSNPDLVVRARHRMVKATEYIDDPDTLRSPFVPRKHTVKELLEAGDYDEASIFAPWEKKAGYIRARTIKELTDQLSITNRDSSILRRIEGKATYQIEDEFGVKYWDEFTPSEENFIEEALDIDLTRFIYDDAGLARIRKAVGSELRRNETRIQTFRARIAEKTELDLAAREAAMQLGIERIGKVTGTVDPPAAPLHWHATQDWHGYQAYYKPGVVTDLENTIEDIRGVMDPTPSIGKSAEDVRAMIQSTPGVTRPGLSQPKRLMFDNKQYEILKGFIQGEGIPFDRDPEMLGRFEISPVYGDRQFIVGAYNDPTKKLASGMPEKLYITYNPSENTWGLQAYMGEKPVFIDRPTGENLSNKFASTIKQIDDQIDAIDSRLAGEPRSRRMRRRGWVTEAHRNLSDQRAALENRKRLLQEEVSKGDLEFSPRVQGTAPSVDEIEAFTKVWDDIYGAQIAEAVRPSRGVGVGPSDSGPFFAFNGESGVRSGGAATPITEEAAAVYEGIMEAIKVTDNAYDAAEKGIRDGATKLGLRAEDVPRPPGVASYKGATPGDSAGYLDQLLHALPNKKVQTALVRLWSGTRQTDAIERGIMYKEGNNILARAGIGTWYQNRLVVSKDDPGIIELFEVLHDSAKPVPPKLQELYDFIRPRLAKEEAAQLAYDPNMGKFLPIKDPEYFPRFWRRRREDGIPGYTTGPVGRLPAHMKARTLTGDFGTLVNEGWEPLSWNPMDMVVLRLNEGATYRETMLLADSLKNLQSAKGNVLWEVGDGVTRETMSSHGYRVPDIGPVFTGRPYRVLVSDEQGKVTSKSMKGEPLAVPNKMADIFESVYGPPPTLSVQGFDILPYISKPIDFSKRMLLAGSGFQHWDMAILRALPAALSPIGLAGGAYPLAGPIRYASLLTRYVRGIGSTKARDALKQRMLSDTPLYKDSDISFRMIGNHGWERGGDPTILRRNVIDHLEEVAQIGPPGKRKLAADRVAGAVRWWEGGLFDVMYAETQMFMLENVIVPGLRRQHPSWTSQELALASADLVNVFTSALNTSQTFLTSSASKELARLMVFSPAETESWFLMAIRPFVGENKLMYANQWIGIFTMLSAVGNAMNMVSTGRPLPLTAYNPISIGEHDTFWPGGIKYNNRFFAPQLPWKGANGQPLYLDLIGQADNVLRLVLDPPDAGLSRMTVIPREIYNQLKGESFHKEPLGGPATRAVHAATSAAPMGVGNVLQSLQSRNESFSRIILQGEQGLDPISYGLQAITGLNVGSANATEIRAILAEESNFASWREMGKNDRTKALAEHPGLARELEQRTETAARRGTPAGVMSQAIVDNRKIRRKVEDSLHDQLFNGTMTFREAYNTWNAEKKKEIIKNRVRFQVYEKTVSPRKAKGPNEKAREQFYGLFDDPEIYERNDLETGIVDWDILDKKIRELKAGWTPEQILHIEENTGGSSTNPYFRRVEELKKKYGYYFDLERVAFESAGLGEEYKKWKNTLFSKTYKRNTVGVAEAAAIASEFKRNERESKPELLLMLVYMGRVDPETYIELQKQVGYTGKRGVPLSAP